MMEQKKRWKALERYVNVGMRTNGCGGNLIGNPPFATRCIVLYGGMLLALRGDDRQLTEVKIW